MLKELKIIKMNKLMFNCTLFFLLITCECDFFSMEMFVCEGG